ncbi:MAG: hypothetical protein HYU69_01780 [Bacteroidetes bacterium]|nr:hypothetical protein [Bacteroidota bacterium]
MEQKPKSEGKCIFCNETFSKVAINRHLQKHLQEKAIHNKPGKSLLLKIELSPKWGRAGYFLSLWVDGEARFTDIDEFLRAIWLECCGHMSSFVNVANKKVRGGMWDFFEAEKLLDNGQTEEYEKMMEDAKGEIPKSRKTKDALYKDMVLEYQYDFGSTTELKISVVAEYLVAAEKNIVLLSRNEPLKILCDNCKAAPAAQLCTAHQWGEDSMFCTKCAKKHTKDCADFDDYASFPVVNSPRMGVCAYTGGSIDKKRDVVFSGKN